MDKEDLIEEIVNLTSLAYSNGLNDGTNKCGYDFDWIKFQDKARMIVGWHDNMKDEEN